MKHLLEAQTGFEVVAEDADGEEALRVVREAHPDVLLLALAMPKLNGVDTLSSPQRSVPFGLTPREPKPEGTSFP